MAYAQSSRRTGAHGRRVTKSVNTNHDMDAEELVELDDDFDADEPEIDWARFGTFTGVLALGTILGAAAALIFAPRSGEETRELIADGARRAGGRARDGWDDLRDELRWAARRGKKQMRRGVTRGAWRAEDAYDRGRRSVGFL